MARLTANGIEYPSFANDPTSPVQGQVYLNTETQRLRLYDGVRWTDIERQSDFLNRQIISNSYVMGGYKSSSPWKNVNAMNHATDVMRNLGDQMEFAGAYSGGVCSLTKGFLFGVDNSWPGISTGISEFDMFTETSVLAATHGNTMLHARNDNQVLHKEHTTGWIMGGNTAVANADVIDLTTDTMSTTASGIDSQIYGDTYQAGLAGHSGETTGHIWQATNIGRKMSFATTTFSAESTGAGGIGSQQKGISSKHGIGYGGNEGTYSGGYNYRRMNYSSDVTSVVGARPLTNSGEENFDMGQYHQYCMGMYDGAQNNRGHKWSYTTENGYELGAGSVRTGVAGGSSGACVWRG